MVGFPVPGLDAGEPKGATAVETGDGAPDPKPPTDKAPAAPAGGEEKPADPAATVNFDGFSDKSKAFYEKALKAGIGTAEDIERHRQETLFQQAFTKKTQKHADAVRAWEAKVAKQEEELKTLDKIRGDERLYDAFLKAARGELDPEDPSGDEIPDRKTAAQIAREEIEKDRRAEQAAKAESAKIYEKKQDAMATTIRETMALLKVDQPTMVAYLAAEEAALGGRDPVLAISPEDLADKVMRRHERAQYEARIAALEGQVSEKTSKQVQRSKQSMQPPRQSAEVPTDDPWERAKAELGVAPDFGNVSGFGFGPQR